MNQEIAKEIIEYSEAVMKQRELEEIERDDYETAKEALKC